MKRGGEGERVKRKRGGGEGGRGGERILTLFLVVDTSKGQRTNASYDPFEEKSISVPMPWTHGYIKGRGVRGHKGKGQGDREP